MSKWIVLILLFASCAQKEAPEDVEIEKRPDTSTYRLEMAQKMATEVIQIENQVFEKVDSLKDLMNQYSLTDQEWKTVKAHIQDLKDSIAYLNDTLSRRRLIDCTDTNWICIDIVDTIERDTVIWDIDWRNATKEDWKQWKKENR